MFLNSGLSTQPFSGSPETLTPTAAMGSTCGVIAIADVNVDGHPDLELGCSPVASNGQPGSDVGAIYINNGTSSPFVGVAPIDIATNEAGVYSRSVAVAALTKGGTPDILLAEGDGFIAAANYFPLLLDPDPVATADSAVVAIDKSVTVQVLTNDSASTGQTLNPSSVTVSTVPTHGSVSVNSANGAITYTPTVTYSGNDAFQYTVRDNLGALSNPANVFVRVQPAPVAANDTAMLSENQGTTLNVLANDTSSGGTIARWTLTITVPPAHGTATITAGTYDVTYQPNQGYSGLDTFQYTVEDNLGTRSNTATVSIDMTAPPASGGKGGGGGVFDEGSLLGLSMFAVYRLMSVRRRSRERWTAANRLQLLERVSRSARRQRARYRRGL